MGNDRLRQALYAKGLTVRRLAELIEVDPKTAERWISEDRVPYPRHRFRVAAVLEEDEAFLWPTARHHGGPARGSARADEVVQMFRHRSSVPDDLWRSLLEQATDRVDVLAFAGLFLFEQMPGLPRLLRNKAISGARVRLLLGDPDSPTVAIRGHEQGIGDAVVAMVRNALTLCQPLASCSEVAVRVHRTTLYASIYQFDEDMLVTCHVYGLPEAHAPTLWLRRREPGDLFETYIRSFEQVWQDAAPAWPEPMAEPA